MEKNSQTKKDERLQVYLNFYKHGSNCSLDYDLVNYLKRIYKKNMRGQARN